MEIQWPWDMEQVTAALQSTDPQDKNITFRSLQRRRLYRIVIGQDDDVYVSLKKIRAGQAVQNNYVGQVAFARDAYSPYWSKQQGQVFFTPLVPCPDAPKEKLQATTLPVAVGLGIIGLRGLEVVSRDQAQAEVMKGGRFFDPNTARR